MADIKPHERVNDILLGPLERPALQWLASKMPKWVTPDVLTFIGFLAAIIICVSYALTGIDRNFFWLASFGFVLNWFGDSLDGTLARYRKIERPKFGFFIDHALDSFSEFLIVLGIGLSPYVKFEYAMLALSGYLLMSIFVFLKTYVRGVFQISFSKFGPTEMRLALIAANTFIYFAGNPILDLGFITMAIYDIIALFIAAVLFILFFVSTWKEAMYLRKLESR
jgi:phosphatidylglycerophosphate synthase